MPVESVPGRRDDLPRRILVCGSRHWDDYATIYKTLQPYIAALPPGADEPTVIHGAARGADRQAAAAASDLGFWVEAHPADWKTHGKAAGPIRNNRMLDTKPDLVIAFKWTGESSGTDHTIAEARKRGIKVEVIHRCGHSCWQVGGETACIYLPEEAL